MAKKTALDTAKNVVLAAANIGTAVRKETKRGKKQGQADAGTAAKSDKITGLTLRLDPDRYERLRTLAFQRRVKMHELMIEGVDYILHRK